MVNGKMLGGTEIEKTNSRLVLNPKFIPVYPEMIREGYTYLESIIYGFIDFFLSNNDKFYCTNEQLGEMLGSSEKTISIAIKKLKDNGLIDIDYKVKAGGGTIRLIKNVNSDFTKMYSQTLQKCKAIENNIIENKYIDSNNITTKSEDFEEKKENSSLKINQKLAEKESSAKEKEYGNQNVNDLINNIKSLCDNLGIVYDKTNDRNFARHILTAKEYGEACDKVGMSRVDFALSVLKASVAINYFKGACSGPQKIYQNYSDVYNRTKAKSQKNYIPQNDAL